MNQIGGTIDLDILHSEYNNICLGTRIGIEHYYLNNFVEKYKVQIGIFLILMIVAGTLILIYEKKELSSILGIKSNNNNDCSCQDYSEKIAVLEEKINNLENNQTSAQSDQITSNSDLININTASQKELEELPGIGAKRASDIIIYREANGGFKTTAEIKNIKGIGESIYSQIEALIKI